MDACDADAQCSAEKRLAAAAARRPPPTASRSLPSPNRRRQPPARARRSYLSWDDYFMALAFLSAQRSKDPNKQVRF